MVLHVDSDATYLTMPEVKSCYVRYFYLSDRKLPRPVKTTPKINGPIHTECKTIHNVASVDSDQGKAYIINPNRLIG